MGISALLFAIFVSLSSSAQANREATHEISRDQPVWIGEALFDVERLDDFQEVLIVPVRVAGLVNVGVQRKLANKLADASGAGGIAVIYPDIGEPYRSVFTQIIDGIEDKARGRVRNFPVGKDVDVGQLKESMRRQDAKVVIALGRQGLRVARSLESDLGLVVGGVLSASDDEVQSAQINSLSPDPALLFARLKSMMPKVRRVLTVYDPRQNEWLIRLAKDAARQQGLELVTYQAQDLRSAMRAYQEILAAADVEKDALWLPQDSTTVEDSSVMPMLLQESWSRNLTMFSSSFSHVRRGVLFSLYPDNVDLGRSLAGSALSLMANGGNGSGLMPLREVLMAINLRTARHLGVNTSRLQSFDMAFPEQ
ncbi:MAG: ABC transporter substrate binding protein [Pseudomonadota bacterium]